jgi:hypothetical protein
VEYTTDCISTDIGVNNIQQNALAYIPFKFEIYNQPTAIKKESKQVKNEGRKEGRKKTQTQ